MAKLARCPACYTELELPAEVADGHHGDARVVCPACEESFLVADAKPREVKQAQLSSTASETIDEVDSQPTAELPPAESSSSGLNESLLESFLRDGPTKQSAPSDEVPADEVASASKPEESETSSTESSLPSLGELKSLEDLFRGGKQSAEESSTTEAESDFGSKETIDIEEPSPVADRLRPTLGELFAESRPEANPEETDGEQSGAEEESNLEESGSYDSVEDLAAEALQESDAMEDAAEDEQAARENKKTPTEFDGMTLHDFAAPQFDVDTSIPDDTVAATAEDAPTFDQTAFDETTGEPAEELDESKSLRASMGFPAVDDPLEVQEEEHEPVGIVTGEQDHGELSFAGVDAPRGVVASRKRGSSVSMARTMMGVVLGGIFGLYAGYLVILWIKVDDPLNAASLYPDVVKPQALRSDTTGGTTMAEESPATEDHSLLAGDDSSSDIDLASLEEPVEEPMPWNQSAAPANTPESDETAVEVTIQNAPQYTAAELQQLTTLAEEASPVLVAAGEIDRSKGSSYATIAKLADALTFGEGDKEASWNYAARQVFPPLFASPQTRGQISQIAGFWLTSPMRKHGGIFFCGTPDAGRQAGSVAEYQFTLPGGQTLTVLSPEVLADNVTSAPTVVVVGSVIYKPADLVEGYNGDEPLVIWSENLLPVGN